MIKSGNEWHAGVDRRGFGTKQDFIPLFFFMSVQILWQGQKAVLTIVEFEFFDIFYSKCQLVSTFSICSNFCVENWSLCCDLIYKWVTCNSQPAGHALFTARSFFLSTEREYFIQFPKIFEIFRMGKPTLNRFLRKPAYVGTPFHT